MDHDFGIHRLGDARIKSPLHLGHAPGDALVDFTPDDARVLVETDLERIRTTVQRGDMPVSMEKAGPRDLIYFDPSKLKAGIVTCGGLCPGLNDVIRGLVMTLHHRYGVPTIFGFKYGYGGLNPEYSHPVLELTPKSVRDIHSQGGTVLGSSRGHQDVTVLVDTLERMNIGLLFIIGGDGSFRGALAMAEEIAARQLKIGVVGIPKTIDNDIEWVDHTFGFQTAVSQAAEAIKAAYSEASSAENGIGLVKLMGRDAGFIAASASLAVRNVNLVLVPEVPFSLDGEKGLIAYLDRRMAIGKFSVLVVAEGAGQHLLQSDGGTDASGNRKLGDIGTFLRDQIKERLRGRRVTIKYIDPSYIIRSAPADSNDAIFCGHLAQAAVHAGMSGRNAMAVGRWKGSFTHVPLQLMVKGRKKIDPEGELWRSVLESTGQPTEMA